jgi:hypothetical protein
VVKKDIKEINSTKVQAHTVTKQQAYLLYILWELNKYKQVDATYELITAEWNKKSSNGLGRKTSKSNIVNLVNEVLDESSELIEKYGVFNSNNNSSSIAFLLHSSAISLPKTARIFLELLAFESKNDEAYLIPKDEFIQFINEKYDWKKDFIESRIDLGVSSGYIRNETKQDIWINIRLKRELEYVKLISDSLTDSPIL